MTDIILDVKGLYKHFGSTCANKNVDFSLKRGEVRGLAGENGSGKSTLLSQISGICRKDSGGMLLNGQPYDPQSPLQAANHKIGIVVQELGVLSTLPAGVNVFAGRLSQFTRFGIINMNALYQEAEKQFQKWGLMPVPLKKTCGNMQIETRKMIELARALSIDPDLLILDEVTQSLSQNNRDMLYQLIENLKAAGKTIVMITHDLEEMIRLCDNITVLRDGEVVGTKACDDLDPDELKRMMVGREVNCAYYREDWSPDYEDEVVLKAEDLSVSGEIEAVSFDVHRGEILGFCGLSDSGIHTVGKAVYGLAPSMKGKVTLSNKSLEIKNAGTALCNGMAYVPKDRDGEALMMQDSIVNNFVFPSTASLKGRLGFLNPGKLRAVAVKGIADFQIKCSGVNQRMDGLSGGNKQKVNLGRWLIKDLDVLILDCPTRGVDVGVKAYIYQLMRQAKEQGLAILLISDELPEIIGMSDRVIIMKDGKINGEFYRGDDFTQEKLIEVMV
ncbi:sugar ABC transporter ATP-binding protein [Anoxybacterium hadale]|uniref:Sugar ABC transporter ATP-binding protein n=1 Tax=Anoxybacterium hadale TaxID=3408580 RepID=A0ACD1ACP7_9FIRM|nr:sugar ABC transporter ATP-binding protein [Clostridiales bacterium]